MGGERPSPKSFASLIADGFLAIGDGYRARNEELGTSGPIFLRSAYLQESGWSINAPDRLEQPSAAVFGPKVAQLGDTVVTTKGNSLGRLGYVNQEIAGAVYSPHLSYWRSLDHRRINPRFLYYWSQSFESVVQIRARSVGTDMAPYLSLRDQLSIEISLPSSDSQQAIGDILGVLDDKIELNQRTAETLEDTARAIFKGLFIDFDPALANVGGWNTGLPEELSAPFQKSIGSTSLPVGWIMSSVGEMFEVRGGNTPSTTAPENWGESYSWATPKDLSGLAYPVLLNTERYITDIGLSRSTSGLLPPGSLLLSSRAPIGYMAFASQPVAINQGFAGFVRRDVSTAYAWGWCSENMRLIQASASGSTFPEISKATLRRLPMLRPSEPALSAFEATVSPIIERLIAAATQSRMLSILRNTLLPKLITGELRIRDAERTIAAA